MKRLATSAAVATFHVGGSAKQARAAGFAAVESYARHMRRYAEMGALEIWYDLIDEQKILGAAPPRLHPDIRAATDKARSRGHIRSLGKLTEEADGVRRLIEEPPVLVCETHLSDGTPITEMLDAVLTSYIGSLPLDRARLLSRYRLVDIARKVVGVGSVGTSCWVILMEGMDAGDPLILQVTEARPSALAAHVRKPIAVSNEGRRVVMGQRLIQGSPDVFLGYGSVAGRKVSADFFVRQRADMKGGFSFDEGELDWASKLPELAALCGWALAHAKSGDPAMIAGYCGRSDALPDAIATSSMAYADQTFSDHAALVAHVGA
jgi:hypothetical protein